MGSESIFTNDEYDELVGRLRLELLPRLEEIRLEREDNHSPSDSAEEHMQPLLDFLRSLLVEFGGDQDLANDIDNQQWLAREWVQENQIAEIDSDPRQLGTIESPNGPESTRSIFDDIDADEQSETE